MKHAKRKKRRLAIPPTAKGKAVIIRQKTARIKKLQDHFDAADGRFRDGNAKRTFGKLVAERGVLMDSLKEQDPALHQELVAEIQKGDGV